MVADRDLIDRFIKFWKDLGVWDDNMAKLLSIRTNKDNQFIPPRKISSSRLADAHYYAYLSNRDRLFSLLSGSVLSDPSLPIVKLFMSSDSVKSGVLLASEYLSLVSSSVNIDVTETPVSVIIRIQEDIKLRSTVSYGEIFLAATAHTIRTFVQHNLNGKINTCFMRIHLCDIDKNKVEDVRDMFNCEAELSDFTAIELSKECWLSPSLNFDETYHQNILEEFVKEKKKFERHSRVYNNVITHALMNKNNALPTPDEVAESLNMTLRNLQRNLKEFGFTYQDILNEIKRDIAFQKMVNPLLDLHDIATSLGFSEGNAFYKAFKRWTSLTPGHFRSLFCESTDIPDVTSIRRKYVEYLVETKIHN